MNQRKVSRKKTTGLPPGTLSDSIDRPESAGEECEIHLIRYSDKEFFESEVSFDETGSLRKSGEVCWLNITGVWNSSLLKKIGAEFNIHPLILEDIQNTGQRPKVEEHKNYLYLVTRRCAWREETGSIELEQISFLLMKDLVITFQEYRGDTFDDVRNRIRDRKGRVRGAGADYLLYALIDSIVDFYLLTVEEIEEKIDDMELQISKKDDMHIPQKLYAISSQLNELRRVFHPMIEVTFQLRKGEMSHIGKTASEFLQDVQDHLFLLGDYHETQKEKLTNLRGMHSMNVSDRMNNIIRVLTIISTIFIPLTFIVGIYGMNFANMPELRVPWAYFVVLGVMAFLGIVMVLIFKRKKWL